LRIKLAETAGFCFGVDRAVNMAYELAEKGCRAVTLGQLIHNPTVTEDLEKKGMRVIENPCDAAEGETVVIRAHGVKKSVCAEL
jgi:4-hydroxy-3-methylbut-2-enyl diphosphate reductase